MQDTLYIYSIIILRKRDSNDTKQEDDSIFLSAVYNLNSVGFLYRKTIRDLIKKGSK
jgi:hypothetical protein